MSAPGSHHWVREYFFRTRGSREFVELKDYQYGWLCRLKTHALANEGYLPTDVNELWTMAGAKTRAFFEKDSPMVLAYFDGRTVDGQRMYNSFDLRELKDGRKKLRLPDEEQQSLSISVSAVAVGLVDPEEQSVTIEKVFAFYCAVLGRDPCRYQLTPRRLEKAGVRLWERIKVRRGNRSAAVQDLRDAIANLALSRWHVENGHVDWIDHVFKSQEIFEKRLDMNLGGEAAMKRQPKSEPYAVQAITPAPVAEQQVAPEHDPWRKVLAQVELSVNRHSFDTWLKPSRFYALVGRKLYVRVPTEEFRNSGEKYGHLIRQTILKLGLDFSVEYVTTDEAKARAKEAV
jgi:hypothetical protein